MRLWASPFDRRRVRMFGDGDWTCCGLLGGGKVAKGSEQKEAPAVKPGTLLGRHCHCVRLGHRLGGLLVRLLGLPRRDHAGNEARHQFVRALQCEFSESAERGRRTVTGSVITRRS